MTPHLNRLVKTVQMRGHNICFSAELTKIISKYSPLFRALLEVSFSDNSMGRWTFVELSGRHLCDNLQTDEIVNFQSSFYTIISASVYYVFSCLTQRIDSKVSIVH